MAARGPIVLRIREADALRVIAPHAAGPRVSSLPTIMAVGPMGRPIYLSEAIKTFCILGTMELRHLRYFVAVGEELHFGRAASRVGIAQPPLSQQIRQLEAELGVQLLRRTKRHVELTDAGRAFLAQAHIILGQVEEAAREARRAVRGEVGRLVVGVVYWADASIYRIIRTFTDRYPDVRLEIQNRNTPDQFTELAEDRLHVGFVALPPHDPAFVGRLVRREALVVAFPEGHRFARFSSIPLRELASEPYTGFPRHIAPVPYDAIAGLCRKGGFTLNVRHEADHVDSVLGLVSAGIGVSLVPASYQQVHRPGIRYRPLADVAMKLQIVLAWRRDNTLPVLHRFLDVVREATAVAMREQRAREELSSTLEPRRRARADRPRSPVSPS